MNKKIALPLLIFCLFSTSAYAQSNENVTEQREFKIQDKMEDLLDRPQTAKDILKILKERAEAKIAEKRRAQFWKYKVAAELYSGYESNPLNTTEDEKSDIFVEEDFSMNWLPTFHKNLSGDFGYRLANQSYSEQTDLSTFDNVFNANLKYYPHDSHDLYFQPGFEYEWLNYPLDETASYEDTRASMRFKHYIRTDWDYGGK